MRAKIRHNNKLAAYFVYLVFNKNAVLSQSLLPNRKTTLKMICRYHVAERRKNAGMGGKCNKTSLIQVIY